MARTPSNLSWDAASDIIGQTSTATIAGGGNPIYLAQSPFYGSTVGLLMQYSDGSAFSCSGSLLSDRSSIVTAGHCVGGAEGTPDKVTAFFYDGNPADPQFYQNALFGVPAPGVTAVNVAKVIVDPSYTGDVVDENDIAVLRLGGAAPTYATGYDLYTPDDLTGTGYNIAGYGARSDVGGSVGADLSAGRLRQGDNRYDFRLGDSDFDGFFSSAGSDCTSGTNFFCGTAAVDDVYIADFDDGLAANDGSCLLATDGFGLSDTSKYCDLGRGATEVSSAPGDSGGPQFVDGKLASVTSFGLTFGSVYGDVDNVLDDTFGEFNGFVPVYTHLGFIHDAQAAAVPEPQSWAMMLAGVGLLGAALRRRTMRVGYAA